MRLCKHRKSALLLLFSKLRADLKRHNRVYILSSKHTYRPMKERVVVQLFYKYLIVPFYASVAYQASLVRAMVRILARRSLAMARYAAEAYQQGANRYLLYPSSPS